MTRLLPDVPPKRSTSASMRWTSTRMWQEQVDDYWVLFAPDRPGLPVVVSQRVMAILDRCRIGATIDTIQEFARALNIPLDSHQVLAVTDFLIQRSFLREEEDRPRYEARDVSEFRPESLGVRQICG